MRIQGNAMISLLAPSANFSPSLLVHLNERLNSATLEGPATLSADETNSGLVILSTGKPGNGAVDHAFPSLCIRERELQPLLDSHIDAFLAKWEEMRANPTPPAKSGAEVPATR
jgi:hypothetical protein